MYTPVSISQHPDNVRRSLIGGLLATGVLISIRPLSAAPASGKIIRDIAGRTVRLDKPIKRILLADGTLAYAMALLRPEEPFTPVIAWGNNFREGDLDSYQAYLKKFPQIKQIPSLPTGGLQPLSGEQVISLQPDVVVMTLGSKLIADSSGLMKILEQTAIPVIFVDFSHQLMANSGRSIQILAELTDTGHIAREFLQFREQQIRRVTQLVPGSGYKPRVMLERAPGIDQDCCLSYGNASLGELVGIAGGDNLGGHFIKGTYGSVSPEQVIAADPDIILLTGANWSAWSPDGNWINLGPGADPKQGLMRLRQLMQRPAWKTLRAVNTGQVYAIWHTFYDNPYNFIALQCFAKWLHPERCATLDPDATFRELHERFLPIPYQPGYWLSLLQDSF